MLSAIIQSTLLDCAASHLRKSFSFR